MYVGGNSQPSGILIRFVAEMQIEAWVGWFWQQSLNWTTGFSLVSAEPGYPVLDLVPEGQGRRTRQPGG
jgi:hypothetical protein